MRRILFLIAAALSATLVYAQDAENVGNSAQLSIIPRIDLNPYVGFRSDAGTDFSLSNSSLYTLFEGSFGEHFSYSIMNHWLSAEPASLYEDTFFHSDVSNWCDWANLTYSFGDFAITLGKTPMCVGTWEVDAYDFDSYSEINSTLWNELQVYQWGGDISAFFAEQYTATFQLTSSPFTLHPFEDGVFSSSLMFRKDEGDFNALASVNMIGYSSSHFIKLLAFGSKYYFEDFVAGVDLNWHFDKTLMVNGGSVAASFEYDASDKLNVIAKAGYEDCFSAKNFPVLPGGPKSFPLYSIPNHFFCGAGAYYFPLRDSDALRLHSMFAYDNGFPGLSINIGALYNFSINIK